MSRMKLYASRGGWLPAGSQSSPPDTMNGKIVAELSYRETLFGYALFDKLQFGFVQAGFEQVLIAINISVMGA
jgi:hypothetical protein